MSENYVEKAAAKIKAVRELLKDYPDGTQVPEDVQSQVRQLFGEFEEANTKARDQIGFEKIQGAVKDHFDFYHKGGGAPPKGDTVIKAPWKSLGEYLIAVHLGGVRNIVDPRLESVEKFLVPEELAELKALSGDIGVSGAYLIPTQFIATLLMKPAEQAIVRPRATIIPMTNRSVQLPSLDQTTVPAGGTAYYGGLVMEWLEESEEKPEVDINFLQVELTAHEVSGWLPVPNSLLADSAISLEALLPKLFGGAITDEEDYRFLRGTGVGQPVGIINAPAMIWVNRNAANTFDFANDVTGMLEILQPGSSPVWIMSPSCKGQVYTLRDANNRYMWIPNMTGAGPGTLMGYPIIWTEKLPVLGTAGDIMLCDFSYYLIGDRERPAMATSIHERFRRNQTTWRISERVDGQPWLSAEVPLRDGTSTVSPFVGLDVPAA